MAMNRRSFLSTLAALPGLGWVKPQEPTLPIVPSSAEQERAIDRLMQRDELAQPIAWGARIESPLFGERRYFVADREVSRDEFYRTFPNIPPIY